MKNNPLCGNRHGEPVLIIGAGRGGVAMIELFNDVHDVRIVGVADTNPDAPGLLLARSHGIQTFQDIDEALKASGQCFVINLTHDEEVSDKASSFVGASSVMGGQSARLFWMMVTRLKATGDELQRSRDKMRAMIQFAVDGIVIADVHGKIATFNRSAEKMFGYKEIEILGQDIGLLIPPTSDNMITMKPGKKSDLNCREVNGKRKDGTIFPMDISANILSMPEGKVFVSILRDITERKAIEEKIRMMAQYDHLTALPNRHLFYERLEWSIKNAKRHGKKLAVLFLDLDGFKRVNDTHGHEVGDMLLIEVSKRLQKCVRESDTVARIGGDEFIIMAMDLTNNSSDVDIIAIKVLEAMCKPFILENVECQIGVSIGIAIYPDDTDVSSDLICLADDAMYLAKKSGKNNIKRYHDVVASNRRAAVVNGDASIHLDRLLNAK